MLVVIVKHTQTQVGSGGITKFGTGNDSRIKARQHKAVIGDDKPFEPQFLVDLQIPKKIIFGANHFASKLPDSGVWLVWDKKHEDSATNDFSDVELMWTNFEGKTSKIYRYIWSGLTRAGNRETELQSRIHPTQKPVGLLSHILERYSNEDDIVLDPYLGSGSTLIAAEQTKRICYGIEIDPYYCDQIITRWENITKQKAKKLEKVL